MEYIPAKTILSAYADNKNWFGTNYNMNLYRGCTHGCIYCDSRSECYQNDDFDTVRPKANALEILNEELASKKKTGVVGSGSMSDPYNPLEKELELSRGALKLIDRYGFGASTITKGTLVTRDIDLFKAISQHSPVLVKITITTPRDKLSRKIEPNAPTSSERFAAIKELSRKGIYCGVLMMPVLPFIEDSESDVLKMAELAYNAGARFIFPMFGVTLRDRQREFFFDQLDEKFPDMKQKYLAAFKNNYECRSLDWVNLYAALEEKCNLLHMPFKMPHIIADYKKNYTEALKDNQISMF